ncbi:MAG: flagellar biosynthesis protein FlhA [Myxococcota bacterium]
MAGAKTDNTHMVNDGLMQILANRDMIAALLMLGVLFLMVVPLAPIVLDLMLVLSITLSLIILMVTFFMKDPLEFTVFPSLLLISTLFRLSLNIASTRLILTHGDQGISAAGGVIGTFGTFVVGGNYAVGFVVFVILTLINFVVITKGSGRIAEVAARFTLDALPGKQMSIDADLNAGLIGEDTARSRRKRVSLEADFYGAMDGASKFIRGDAVAGIFIMITNVVGGLFIGVIQKGMPALQALENYTVLTIGDGLVSQVPSLIVSTAAGILVTRVNSETQLDKELTSQLFSSYRILAMVAVMLGLFVLVPGLRIPFFVVAASLGGFAYYLWSLEKRTRDEELARAAKAPSAAAAAAAAAAKNKEPEKIESLLAVDILELEVGYDLISLVDERKSGELLERILRLRKQFALNLGIVVPPIHIKDNLRLAPGDYAILLKGTEIAKGALKMRYLLAINPGNVTKRINGLPTREPAFGLPALWIPERDKELAAQAGYTVVDLPTVLSTHVSEVVKAHAHEFLGRQELQVILDGVAKSHPKVVDELIPNLLPFGTVLKVLQNLLREQISIRDMLTILEAMADFAPRVKDPDVLTELVRQRMARQISKSYCDMEDTIKYLGLPQMVEDSISKGITHTELGSQLVLDPITAQNIVRSIGKEVENHTRADVAPVLLCSPNVRGHVRRLVERFLPNVPVLSHNEISSGIKLVRLGVVSVRADGK